MTEVVVAGVGMIPFKKPGASEHYNAMGAAAVRLALADAGLDYREIRQAYAGFVYGDSTAGQAALYEVGMTGIPVVNVNNNCSTGSTALYLARQAVLGGQADCVLALGFEEMVPGALGSVFHDRPSPLDRFVEVMNGLREEVDRNVPFSAQMFGGAGAEYAKKYGVEAEVFGMISVKARRHATNNPLAIFREPLSLEEVMASPPIYGPLTRFQCCPPTCGAAAAVVCSREFAKRHGIQSAVPILAQSMATDFSSTFDGNSMLKIVGYDMTRAASSAVYEAAGVGPEDIKVVELHDCFTTNELLTYEGLGLTPEGTAEQFIRDGDNTYGGKTVTNPSGGLLSKGHPLGATGLAQCFELVQQLRGAAGPRQVDGVKVALQHNLGLGGAAVVTLYGSPGV